ncbi:MAG: SagB/ThcOx family dehydrogenase [bacterium]|nr:SagB/ThcOx family dehydrogenase [bacterium]
MHIDFSGLFHQSSKDRSGEGGVNIPLDSSLWPVEWKTLFYKQYPRFKTITLGDARPRGDLSNLIRSRRSHRDFAGRPLNKARLGTLLKYACGTTSEEENGYHRAQPSGGGRYPLEVYPIIFVGGDGIPSGLYHYNIKEHGLDALWTRAFVKEDIAELFTYPWAQNASCALVITAVFERNQMKYGERGYRQILIEAGAIVQNIYLVATALGIKCCAIDGVREPEIERLLDIDGFSESAICSLVLG